MYANIYEGDWVYGLPHGRLVENDFNDKHCENNCSFGNKNAILYRNGCERTKLYLLANISEQSLWQVFGRAPMTIQKSNQFVLIFVGEWMPFTEVPGWRFVLGMQRTQVIVNG